MSDLAIDKKNLFFIVARIRSGTTLLNRILNNHPAVFVPQESPFIMNLYHKYHYITDWKEEKILAFAEDLFLEKRVTQYWKLNQRKELLESSLLALGKEATFERLCKTVIHTQAINRGKENVSMLGDKNPTYSLYLEELIHTFPNAKFVLLVRDVRDNILSCQRVTFDFNDTVILAQRWVGFNKVLLDIHERYPTQTKLVKFEDILSEQEVILKDICSFIGLDFDPQMMEFHKNKEKLESWNNFVSRPLEKKKVQAWKEKMSVEDIEKAELISQELLKELGYEISNSNFSNTQYLLTLPKSLVGKNATLLEKYIYRFPLHLRVKIIDTYRRLTGTIK